MKTVADNDEAVGGDFDSICEYICDPSKQLATAKQSMFEDESTNDSKVVDNEVFGDSGVSEDDEQEDGDVLDGDDGGMTGNVATVECCGKAVKMLKVIFNKFSVVGGRVWTGG